MQRTWREDADKLTFIACLPLEKGLDAQEPGDLGASVVAGEGDGEERMIGDVNLFLGVAYEEDADGTEMLDRPYLNGEAELMIASLEHRGRGLGRAALLSFFEYVRRHADTIIAQFSAGEEGAGGLEGLRKGGLRLGVKIGRENVRSRGLFESVGFEQVGGENYFGEVELRLVKGVEGIPVVKGWKEVRYVREDAEEGR